MTIKQQYIDTIIEACIKANPSIKDLVFGCEIKTRWNSKAIILGKSKRKSTKTEEWYRYMHGVTSSTLVMGAIIEIIGRQIQLPDVLLAIDKLYSQPMFIDQSGWFWGQEKRTVTLQETILKPTGIEFKVKETLENQSEETLKFISELL